MEKLTEKPMASADKTEMSNSFNGIDLFKLICAYMVMIIHIAPFQTGYGFEPKLNFIVVLLSRMAVPFFFTASGFLLFRKTELRSPDMGRVRNYAFRILRLYAMWSILLFIGGMGQFWYFSGVAVAVIVLSLFLKSRIAAPYLIAFSVFLYFVGILGDAYYGFIESLKQFSPIDSIFDFYDKYFYTTRNGLFFGLPFVFMGALFAHKKIKLKLNTAVFGFILSVAALFAEGILLKTYSHPKDFNILISLVPAVFFAFHIAINIKLKSSPIYKRIRSIGVLIFCLHMLVYNIVVTRITYIFDRFGIDFCPLLFPICAFLTTALAVLIEWLSRKKRLAWLRYLYS